MSTCVRCRAICADGAAICSSCGAPQPAALPAAPPAYSPPGSPPAGYTPLRYPQPGSRPAAPPAYSPPGSPPAGYTPLSYPQPGYPQPGTPPPGYPPPGTPPPGYPPPGTPPTGYTPLSYPPTGFPSWGTPVAVPQRRRSGNGAAYLLVAVVVLGAAAFGTYRLNLVPALTRQVDTLIGTAGGGGAAGGTPAPSFVAADGNPVDGDSFGEPAASAAAESAPSADHPFIAPDVDRDTLDADLKSIEAAFAGKDPAKVKEWVHPDARARLMRVFEANAGRLDTIATLLATRRPVFVGAEYAEYEVTDKGRTYTVVYQRSGDHWLLVEL